MKREKEERVAGVIEFFGGLLVALGLLSGYAAFIASGHMKTSHTMLATRALRQFAISLLQPTDHGDHQGYGGHVHLYARQKVVAA